jgi:hypothetical protein
MTVSNTGANVSALMASALGARPDVTRIDLDSHANMTCLGKECTVVRRTGKCVNVNAFTKDVGKLKAVPLVDAVIVYEDRAGKVYLLVVYNALSALGAPG